ncbi:MAG: hypothetical protein EDX89_04655 [Acidobacteria bacterium]|nr:MAG: hypothetical protein EDX89_04655 [Acidobacteriota bacterium]MCE7956774.1 hypothetical protein [Acidobacteria bacterium ACB2]
MPDNAADFVLDIPGCIGTVSDGRASLALAFRVSMDRFAGIAFSHVPLPVTPGNFWLLGAGNAQARLVPALSFVGVAPDQRRVTSDRLYVTSSGSQTSPETGATVQITAAPARVRVEAPNQPNLSVVSASGFSVEYRMVGMRGFGRQIQESPLGRLTVAAPSKLDHSGQVAGVARLDAGTVVTPCDQWLTECDSLVHRLLEILSLVQGRRLHWCIRELWHGEQWISADLRESHGSTQESEPLWYQNDLWPFVELAVTKYSERLREERGLGLAIEWLFAHSSYAEVKLASAQATLEYLAACYEKSERLSGSALTKAVFVDHVRPEMELALKRASAALEGSVDAAQASAAIELYGRKLGNLNALTLRERLFRMLDADRVPYAGLETPLKDAISARGSTVHGGGSSGSPDDLIRHIAVLREVAKRIVLTVLGYKGKYLSYLNGHDEVDLSAMTTTVVAE